MKVLIDTHIFLWIATEPEKLSPRAHAACSTETLLLSVASVWEISIKHRIGRLTLPGSPVDYLAKQIRFAGALVLPIQFRHAVLAGGLSTLHKDPFDRMLAAQCLEEHLPFVTKDGFFAECGVETIW
jgi:PIN domain nuclease of toxin-antitoxin system